ncbi:hypothetical protein F53441_4808 [Fusarium austroafricanum]|uniref:Uncharacterized protein n=1 Tax=Fusarium austroafricanum TaxID=2364996 RepID=A0A8H4P1D1_9HYPO|nr:hypothetical protein F53441_4808 [Fusarium austroafricanum]
MKTWFLPPDFTFTPDGTLPLGAVIAHPSRPSEILASPQTDPSIVLPKTQTLVETNHTHSKEASYTAGVGILAKFIEFVSGSVEYEVSRRHLTQYGTADHEVRSLVTPFSKEFLDSLMALQSVQEHINSGLFGKRPLYLVTGLRITNTSFTVTKETRSGKRAVVSAVVPTVVVPIEAGGSISGGFEKNKTESYETAPGIVFAYRLHVIRPKSNRQPGMFSNRKAFMTPLTEPELFEALDVTLEVYGEDLEEEVPFVQYEMGADECCLRAAV